MPPSYKLEDFERACAEGRDVKVLNPALKTAPIDFGLQTEADIISFIGNGGLETPTFANNELWRNNPDPKTQVYVDSYNFYSGQDYGYVAFMRGFAGKWLLKSLKKNENPSPKPFLLAEQLRKAGLIK